MDNAGDLARENESLRERLSRLSEASLRISESLDFDNVLQDVVDSARVITGARCAGMTTLDGLNRSQDFITSGMSPEERQWMLDFPEGPLFLEYLLSLAGPLRIGDFQGHIRALGLPEFQPPVAVTPCWRRRCAAGARRWASSTSPRVKEGGS